MNASSNQKKDVQAIGEAWLETDGTITLHLRQTADGMPLTATFTYKTDDKDYESVLEHLGGLKPGETKLVPPWP